MAESQSHKRAKNKAAGRNGRTEIPISRGRRLDAKNIAKKRGDNVLIQNISRSKRRFV